MTITKTAALCLSILLPMLFSVSGCDTFFVVRGTLSYCGTQTGLPAATVVATVDPGSIGPETGTFTTDSVGKFDVHLNKPSSTPVTMTFAKPGFVTASRQFRGLPTTPYRLDMCLEPAP